jgi:hypothetical protein
LRSRDWEIYLMQVGDEPRRLGTGADDLGYEPWRSGTYWVLACKPEYCFVTHAATHVVF